jgi:nucleoside 2-deoxyribosyltransferase
LSLKLLARCDGGCSVLERADAQTVESPAGTEIGFLNVLGQPAYNVRMARLERSPGAIGKGFAFKRTDLQYGRTG